MLRRLSILVFAVLAIRGARAVPVEQEVLSPGVAFPDPNDLETVRKELEKAEVIPTVLDDFLPIYLMNVSWTTKWNADLGNTLPRKKVQKQPVVTIISNKSPTLCTRWIITMTDPDAPSRDDPKWSEMCHWIAYTRNASHSDLPTDCTSDDLAFSWRSTPYDYKAPAPPKKTGKHRYVFVAYRQLNESRELRYPNARKHWGYDEEGRGVRDWAKDNELVPVAANFIYVEH